MGPHIPPLRWRRNGINDRLSWPRRSSPLFLYRQVKIYYGTSCDSADVMDHMNYVGWFAKLALSPEIPAEEIVFRTKSSTRERAGRSDESSTPASSFEGAKEVFLAA